MSDNEDKELRVEAYKIAMREFLDEEKKYVPFGTINAVTVAASDDFYLLQGDTIGCSVLQNNGGSLSFTGTGNANSFSIERVGN
jgi:hypothetical protein